MNGFTQGWRVGWMVVVGVVLIGVAGLWGVGRVTAQPSGTIIVTSTADIVVDDGQCTLREAINASNMDIPSGNLPGECVGGTVEDIIMLNSGIYEIEIVGMQEDANVTGDFDLWGNTTIQGTGTVVINAFLRDRIFHVQESGSLTLRGLTLQNGRSSNGVTPNDPGEDGGAILSRGDLQIFNSIVKASRAGNGARGSNSINSGDGGRGGNGGGIAQVGNGLLLLEDVIIENNRAGNGGGAGDAYCVVGCTGGSAGSGGGIAYSGNGFLLLKNVAILNNRAGDGGRGGDGYCIPYGCVGGSAGNGGGIDVAGSSTNLNVFTDLEIIGNQTGFSGEGGTTKYGCCAPSGSRGSGGGVFVASTSSILVDQTIIQDNFLNGGLRSQGSHGGGVANHGVLQLVNSTVVNNQTALFPLNAYEHGGGIFNAGTLSIAYTILKDNQSEFGGGAGLYQEEGDTEIYQSLIEANIGDYEGGGIYILQGEAVVKESIIRNNRSEGDGGGIYIDDEGYLTVTESLIDSNKAIRISHVNGGGIANYGNLWVSNSTISQNIVETMNSEVRDATGGGVLAGGTTRLINNTIVNNYASDEGGGIWGTVITATNSIIANNETLGMGNDCSGTLNSGGYNLIQDIEDCIITGTTTGNIIGQASLLESLADNGGPTETYALSGGSPARDAGFCDPTTHTDQRGYARRVDLPETPNVEDGCDMGAFEVQGVVAEPNFITVAEGDNPQTYQIGLLRPPTAAVTITLAYTDEIVALPPLLVFGTTTWTLPQTVTVNAIEDGTLEGVITILVNHTSVSDDPFYNDIPVGSVRVRVEDNESEPPPTMIPTATRTPTPTNTPTITPTPTNTVPPTYTPYPTYTQIATYTPYPTYTPQGGSWNLFLPMIRR